jgi:hypothetical protein
MLILAGTVLVLAFLIAAFAASEIATQEQQLALGPTSDLPSTFSQTRTNLAEELKGLVIPTMDNTTLQAVFLSERNEMEDRVRADGMGALITIANSTDPFASKTEKANFTDGAACGTAKYTTSSFNASRSYTGVWWDCGNDGIIWDNSTQQISGVIVYMAISTPTTRLDDHFVIALN